MVTIKKKEIIVFDFDGTLVDSEKEIVDAYNDSFTKNNLYRVPARTIKRHLGKFRETIIHKIGTRTFVPALCTIINPTRL